MATSSHDSSDTASGTPVPPDDDSSSSDSGQLDSSSTGSSVSGRPGPPAEWDQHIEARELITKLNQTLTAVFPNEDHDRYSRVFVLLVRWQGKDPNPLLDFAQEIERLRYVFHTIFHFDIEVFEIPRTQSHIAMSQKINEFALRNGNSAKDLKIFFYSGHGKLTKSKDLIFSRNQDAPGANGETVNWSGIQTTLEQAASDVLILLECCQSGRVTRGEGNGVTELIAACDFDSEAYGGPNSFTRNLVNSLEVLARAGRFTAAALWSHLYEAVQIRPPTGLKGEKFPTPVHFFITNDKLSSLRSIVLRPWAPCPPSTSGAEPPGVSPGADPHGLKRHRAEDEEESSAKRQSVGRPRRDGGTMLFAIRLQETLRPEDLSLRDMENWFRTIPTLVSSIEGRFEIQGQFDSHSTVLLVTLPLAFWPCLRDHPAITAIGPVKSSNLWPAQRDAGLKRIIEGEASADVQTADPMSLRLKSSGFDDETSALLAGIRCGSPMRILGSEGGLRHSRHAPLSGASYRSTCSSSSYDTTRSSSSISSFHGGSSIDEDDFDPMEDVLTGELISISPGSMVRPVMPSERQRAHDPQYVAQKRAARAHARLQQHAWKPELPKRESKKGT